MRNIPDSATWHKSSYSGGDGGNCLEVALTHLIQPTHIPVRDSKNPHGPKLVFRAESWSLFIEEMKRD
ncbi:DUF397 domain-containing protein [Streptomyces sp. NPDC014892]|uniref:DUF397 domain-containing protein n=1 Tax=Streptomyces sp. NPDC014892 TaxID=3364930 RepID=UPI0036F63F7B